MYHGSDNGRAQDSHPVEASASDTKPQRAKKFCLFCRSTEHYLPQCTKIVQRSPVDEQKWLKCSKRCCNCGRTSHPPDACTLKKPCSECQGIHLRVLHDIAKTDLQVYHITPQDKAALSNSKKGGKVYLKVVPVIISHSCKSLRTYAILDDGAGRTVILPASAQHLLQGKTEVLTLCTIRQNVAHLDGQSVSFHVSPLAHPKQRHLIKAACAAGQLTLAEQCYLMAALRKRYRHLWGIPILL